MRRVLGLLLIVLCASCTGGAQSPAQGVAFPLFPMVLVMTGAHEAGEPLAELRADGSIVVRRRSFVGHLYPDRIVGPDGRALVTAAPDGSVTFDPRAPPGRFDARGALVSTKGDVIWVDDAGVPSWTERRGGMPPLQLRFQPFSPAARRTAEAIFVVAMMVMWERGIAT